MWLGGKHGLRCSWRLDPDPHDPEEVPAADRLSASSDVVGLFAFSESPPVRVPFGEFESRRHCAGGPNDPVGWGILATSAGANELNSQQTRYVYPICKKTREPDHIGSLCLYFVYSISKLQVNCAALSH